MKKIMFSDKYGLTASVINGTKTMTRRIVSGERSHPAYNVGEVVAVAQNYQDAINEYNRLGDKAGWGRLIANIDNGCAGYRNKMFVRADLMPHRIRITDVRVERLQDISDEDCIKEGIFKVEDHHLHDDAYAFVGSGRYYSSPRAAFEILINRFCRKDDRMMTWRLNPLVFVYTFKQER